MKTSKEETIDWKDYMCSNCQGEGTSPIRIAVGQGTNGVDYIDGTGRTKCYTCGGLGFVCEQKIRSKVYGSKFANQSK